MSVNNAAWRAVPGGSAGRDSAGGAGLGPAAPGADCPDGRGLQSLRGLSAVFQLFCQEDFLHRSAISHIFLCSYVITLLDTRHRSLLSWELQSSQ